MIVYDFWVYHICPSGFFGSSFGAKPLRTQVARSVEQCNTDFILANNVINMTLPYLKFILEILDFPSEHIRYLRDSPKYPCLVANAEI